MPNGGLAKGEGRSGLLTQDHRQGLQAAACGSEQGGEGEDEEESRGWLSL